MAGRGAVMKGGSGLVGAVGEVVEQGAVVGLDE